MSGRKIKTEKSNEALDERKSKAFLPTEESEKNVENKKQNQIKNTSKKVKPQKEKLDLFDKLKKNFNEQVKETKEIVQENKEELRQTTQQKLEEAKQHVEKKTNKTKLYFYALFLTINVVCFSVILFMLSSSAMPLGDALKDGHIAWFVSAFLSFVLVILIETLMFSVILKKSSNKFKFGLNFKTVAIGRYYDCITPFKGGGQPFQIYYFNKFGEKGKHAASVPVSKFVISQFVYLVFIILLLFNIRRVNFVGETTFSSIVNVAAYIGLGFQVLWLITILFLSYSKKVGPAMVIGVLKFLAFFRIVKDYRVAYIKVLKFVREYQFTMRKCMSNFWRFLFLVISNALIMIIRWSVPFFLYCGLCTPNLDMYFQMLAYSMLLELALGFWILPGNVIFADLAFIAFFRSIFGDHLIFWAILFWRIITYYSYILLGALVKTYDFIKYGLVKKAKEKKTKNNIKLQN